MCCFTIFAYGHLHLHLQRPYALPWLVHVSPCRLSIAAREKRNIVSLRHLDAVGNNLFLFLCVISKLFSCPWWRVFTRNVGQPRLSGIKYIILLITSTKRFIIFNGKRRTRRDNREKKKLLSMLLLALIPEILDSAAFGFYCYVMM
jgi:hypothetical protein